MPGRTRSHSSARRASPALRALCDGFADGVNYYLHCHPEEEPRLLDHFEPWFAAMALVELANVRLGLEQDAGVDREFLTRAGTDREVIEL